MPVPLLEVKEVSKKFGGVTALSAMSLSVNEREIVGLIGPNGAGKTSFFNAITGLLRADSGEISLGGDKSLNGLSSNRILEAGVARTFQNLRLFKNMSAIENIAIGFHTRMHTTLIDAVFDTPRSRREEERAFVRAVELLNFIGLKHMGDELAGNLSYGGQKRLEIARALASEPRILLLDEPVAGMNPSEKDEIAELVRRIRARGIAVLVIEHDMRFVMPLSDRVVVMDEGAKIAEGRPDQVRSDKRVIEAYLGQSHA